MRGEHISLGRESACVALDVASRQCGVGAVSGEVIRCTEEAERRCISVDELRLCYQVYVHKQSELEGN
jgi:hypothetical protein